MSGAKSPLQDSTKLNENLTESDDHMPREEPSTLPIPEKKIKKNASVVARTKQETASMPRKHKLFASRHQGACVSKSLTRQHYQNLKENLSVHE